MHAGVRHQNTALRISPSFCEVAKMNGNTIKIGSQHNKVIINTNPTPLVALSVWCCRLGKFVMTCMY